MARNEGKNNEGKVWKNYGEKNINPNRNTLQRIPRYFFKSNLFKLDEIQTFIHYTRDLRFDDRPDYTYLKRLLKTIAEREKFEYDYVFDWVIKKQENVIVLD